MQLWKIGLCVCVCLCAWFNVNHIIIWIIPYFLFNFLTLFSIQHSFHDMIWILDLWLTIKHIDFQFFCLKKYEYEFDSKNFNTFHMIHFSYLLLSLYISQSVFSIGIKIGYDLNRIQASFQYSSVCMQIDRSKNAKF